MLAGRTIRDVNSPDVVGSIGRHMAEQVGEDAVFQIAFAQIGAGTDSGNPHLTHASLYPFAIDHPALALQFHRDAS